MYIIVNDQREIFILKKYLFGCEVKNSRKD